MKSRHIALNIDFCPFSMFVFNKKCSISYLGPFYVLFTLNEGNRFYNYLKNIYTTPSKKDMKWTYNLR